MKQEHSVFIIPGLGDEHTILLRLFTQHWKLFHLQPIVFPLHWHDQTTDFSSKLATLIDQIDQEFDKGNRVSIVGTSAGGSAVINAFVLRKKKIHKAINVCGRLRVGPTTGFRSFSAKSMTSPVFAESVIQCEHNLLKLTSADKHKISTLHAQFGDELVPADTTIIPEATNISMPSVEHVLTIGLALTIFSRKVIEFLHSPS